MTDMKILQVEDKDFDCYNDWLIDDAAINFEQGGYTHIEIEGEIIKCEVVPFHDGTTGVSVGESVDP